MRSEEVTFSRDSNAILVPDGVQTIVPEGTWGLIMQVLGGNVSMQIETGQMVRLDAENVDAIGKDPQEFIPETVQRAREGDGGASEEDVWAQLQTCYDPEIPVNIVDLGLVYTCDVSEGEQGKRIYIEMTLTAPGCGMGDILVSDVETKVRQLPGIEDVQVEMVFDPPWSMEMISEAARLELGI